MAGIRDALLRRGLCGDIGIIDGGRYITRAALARRAAAVQARVSADGTGVAAVFLPNGADFVAALWGIFACGMVAFPLSVALTVHEVSGLLEQACARVVVTSRAYEALFEGIARSMPLRILYLETWDAAADGMLPDPAPVCGDAPMLLLATSGTTGRAKIVQLCENNIASNVHAFIEKMDYDRYPQGTVRVALGTPYSSVYGIMILCVCLVRGLTIVVTGDITTPDVLFKAVEAHRVTHFEGGVSVGLMMERMAGRPTGFDISALGYMGLAGSDLPADVIARLMDAYPGIEFWPGYGMTEAGPLIAKPDKRVDPNKLASVGTPIERARVMIDRDGVLTDAPRAVGEIAVKSPGVMMGYFRDAEATNQIIRGGFLYTGDIGYFDEDGYLYICGRKKNVIIVRGLNVHAEEVEACVMSGGLARECVVYGEPDPAGGERVCADIVPAYEGIGAEDIRAYISERLARFKQPRVIRVVAALDKTPTGKAVRR